MELRLLRSFIAAAEDGNISKAAARLSVTQPALSRQIKTLEDDLGVALLERGAHSFSLTPAGDCCCAMAASSSSVRICWSSG